MIVFDAVKNKVFLIPAQAFGYVTDHLSVHWFYGAHIFHLNENLIHDLSIQLSRLG